MTKLYIEVKADTNDADYITQRTEITEDDLVKLAPIVAVVKSNDGEWPNHEYSGQHLDSFYVDSGLLSNDDVEHLDQYVPCGEVGVHHIESITILTVTKEEKLL